MAETVRTLLRQTPETGGPTWLYYATSQGASPMRQFKRWSLRPDRVSWTLGDEP